MSFINTNIDRTLETVFLKSTLFKINNAIYLLQKGKPIMKIDKLNDEFFNFTVDNEFIFKELLTSKELIYITEKYLNLYPLLFIDDFKFYNYQYEEHSFIKRSPVEYMNCLSQLINTLN